MATPPGYVDLTNEQHFASALEPGKKTRDHLKKMSFNIITLIQSSNACPFVQNYDMFRCFYCQSKFADVTALREHSESEHSIPNVKPQLDALHKGTYVMVDITGLKCRICKMATPTISHLRHHIREHGKLINEDVAEGLIPFKLGGDTFDCLICGQQFAVFQMLSQHMNLHYGDKVCEICGQGFLSHGRLKSHKVIHKEREVGKFPCDSCDKIFLNELKRRRHVQRVHEKKARYRCPRCPENFTEYYLRITHMYNVHDIEPREYKCEVCGLGYRRPHQAAMHAKKCRQIIRDAVERDLEVVLTEGDVKKIESN